MDTNLPESFDGITDAELDAMEASIIEEFDAKYDNDTPAPVADLTEIAEALDAVRSEQAARTEQADADSEARAALGDRVRPVAEEDVFEEIVAEVVEEIEVAEELELVTASLKPKAPSARRMATRDVTPPAAEAKQMTTITAAADIPGITSGSQLDRMGLARAFAARSRGLADHSPRVGVATVDTGIPEEHFVRDGGDSASQVMEAVVASSLRGKDAQSLVASGGFCTPSENMYELFSIESRDGLLDLPTMGVSRGGIKIPSYIGLSDVSSALWTWTEATDITPGASVKACLQVPCPTWTDYRLIAEGLCLTAGNFMDKSYPEMLARTTDLAMTAHMHRVSAAHLAAIVAGATAVTVTSLPTDAAGDILSAVDLQVADYRSTFTMSPNAVLEAVFPTWVRGAIRSTLAARAGIGYFDVSDEDITRFFTIRGVRPQFVTGQDPITTGTALTAWPTTTTFLLFPAGGYVAGDGGTIDLGVVRDSTLNATNDFTLAWTEQFMLTAQRGPAARNVTVSTVVDGQTGGPEFVGA
ncbi:major capsid protein [Ilumatobacter sp.]|uniref:major capsid protein n=1 Tax=Ilumatobacter sp. TaxID=1967498 RepID=UPI003752685A